MSLSVELLRDLHVQQNQGEEDPRPAQAERLLLMRNAVRRSLLGAAAHLLEPMVENPAIVTYLPEGTVLVVWRMLDVGDPQDYEVIRLWLESLDLSDSAPPERFDCLVAYLDAHEMVAFRPHSTVLLVPYTAGI